MGCGSSTVLQPVQDAQTVEFDRLMEEEKAEAQLHFKVRKKNSSGQPRPHRLLQPQRSLCLHAQCSAVHLIRR